MGSSVKTWEPEEDLNEDLIRQYHITRMCTRMYVYEGQ